MANTGSSGAEENELFSVLELDEHVGAESEADADQVPEDSLQEAVVSGSDWTVATILDQLRRGNIDLAPKFQRRGVWQTERKSRFIESLILGLPVPQIVLAEKPKERGRFIVLDGKQRLLTIRQFCSDPNKPEDSGFDALRLKGLTLLPQLNGRTYVDLRDEPGLIGHRDAFDNNPVRTVFVRNWPSTSYLYLVFLRLNTGSVPLSPQELRQALQPGPFTDFVDTRAMESKALHKALNLNGPDFRMRDTEVLLRAIAFDLRANKYAGNMKVFLDTTCEKFNHAWESREDEVIHSAVKIESAIELALEIFGVRKAFSRYTDGESERRFNRAVFDIMVHSLAQVAPASITREVAHRIEDAFSNLCANDADFVMSITTTTKSLEATRYRFIAWTEAISRVVGQVVIAPQLRGN